MSRASGGPMLAAVLLLGFVLGGYAQEAALANGEGAYLSVAEEPDAAKPLVGHYDGGSYNWLASVELLSTFDPVDVTEEVEVYSELPLSAESSSSLESDETEATESVLPVQNVSLSTLNETVKSGNQSASANLEEAYNAKVVMRGLEKSPGSGETTAAGGLNYWVVKWALIGVIVCIPIVLLPVLFVFTRARNQQGQSPTFYEPTGGEAGQAMHGGDVAQKYPMAISIVHPVTLHSTGAPQNDPYLVAGASNPGAPVRTSIKTNQPCYWLAPEETVTWRESGQLFHYTSGLLFNPICATFDPATQRAKYQQNGQTIEPDPNLVYDPESKIVYERCLAISWHKEDGEEARRGNGGQWVLPRSPVPQHRDQVRQPIRRARAYELPQPHANAYAELLHDWQQRMLEKEELETQQPKQEVESQMGEPKPVQEQPVVHKEEAEKSPELKTPTEKSRSPDPLLVTKRDFSQIRNEDLASTPRDSLQASLPYFKLPPAPAKLQQEQSPQPVVANVEEDAPKQAPAKTPQPSEQESVYMDASSKRTWFV